MEIENTFKAEKMVYNEDDENILYEKQGMFDGTHRLVINKHGGIVIFEEAPPDRSSWAEK